MKETRIVLKNKANEVVRTYKVGSGRLVVALNKETYRLEILSAPNELSGQEETFKILADTDVKELKNSPLKLARGNRLEVEDDIQKFTPTYEISNERGGNFKEIFRWTAIGHLSLVALILIASLFLGTENQEEERIVTVYKQRTQPKPSEPKTVSMTEKKPPQPKKQVRKKQEKKKPEKTKNYISRAKKQKVEKKKEPTRSRNTRTARTQKPTAKKNRGGQGGALGVLGQFNNKSKSYGKSAKSRTARRAGSGSQSQGGRSAFGKGLTASSPGGGDRAARVAGTGTKGRAGGHKGYGKITTVGNSSAIFTPVDSDAVIEGGLARDQIAAVIRRHLGQIRYCYEKGLQVTPELSGRVDIQFIINPTGKVNAAKIAHTSLRSRRVESCLVQRLRSWKFPKPVGNVNVKVTYPFKLKRVSQG